MNYNKNVGYGQGLIAFARTICPTFGNILVVMNSDNSDESNYHKTQEVFNPDPMGLVRFYTSLSEAYDAAESNNNDIILLDANSNHTLTSMLTVAKSRVHFVGMDGGGRLKAQGAKISMGVTADTDDIAVILNTGTRNSFRNLKIYSSNTLDEHLSCFIDNAEGTYIENCNIAAISKADADACDMWCSADSSTYREVTFGADNVMNSAAFYNIKFDGKTGGGSLQAKSCTFIDCVFDMQCASAPAATSCFMKVTDKDAIQHNILVKNCVFQNFINAAGGVILTDAFLGAATTTNGDINLVNPTIFGATGVGGGSGCGFNIAGSQATVDDGGLAVPLSD